jgi:hypothetical protein
MTSSTKPDPKLLALANRKEAQLIGLLGALSEELAVQLAEALERDRLAGGSGLPFDAIMTGLRPKLRTTDPAARRRVPTPQRAFFEVLEGLIVNDPGEDKQTGVIARPSLAPIWTWLLANTGGAMNDAALGKIKIALLKNDRDEARAGLALVDAAAAAAVRAAIKKADADPKYARDLASELGGHQAYQDFAELARILPVAREIRELRDKLPPVIDDKVEEQFTIIRVNYEAVEEAASNSAPYIVLSLASRVSHPWELFGIAARLVRADDDQDLKDSDLAMVGEWLVLGLETEASALRRLKVATFDAVRADEILRRFAVLQAGMTREVGMRKDGVWGKRLLKARGTISDALENLFAGISHELHAGLAMEKATSGAKSGALVPAIREAPDEKLITRLESLTLFLRTARLFSGQLGYGVAFEKVKVEVTMHLEGFGNGVVEALRNAKKREREVPQAWADACQRIMKPILSDEAMKVFNRRLASAVAEPTQAKAQG